MKRLLLGGLRVAVTLLLSVWVFSRISLREALELLSGASLAPLAAPWASSS